MALFPFSSLPTTVDVLSIKVFFIKSTILIIKYVKFPLEVAELLFVVLLNEVLSLLKYFWFQLLSAPLLFMHILTSFTRRGDSRTSIPVETVHYGT